MNNNYATALQNALGHHSSKAAKKMAFAIYHNGLPT
jgi:hypothetical protein